jgi:hypothetical protein
MSSSTGQGVERPVYWSLAWVTTAPPFSPDKLHWRYYVCAREEEDSSQKYAQAWPNMFSMRLPGRSLARKWGWARSQAAKIRRADGPYRVPRNLAFDYRTQGQAGPFWLPVVRAFLRRARDRTAGPQQQAALAGAGNGLGFTDNRSLRGYMDCAIIARS